MCRVSMDSLEVVENPDQHASGGCPHLLVVLLVEMIQPEHTCE